MPVRTEKTRNDAADVCRIHRRTQLHRHSLLELPWKKKSRVSKDIVKAGLVLDVGHYGLEKVKERIFWNTLAVQKRMRTNSKRARFCAWSALRAWAKPLWANPSPKQRGGNMSAWLWAACATKAKSGFPAAPISAPCLVRFCRIWQKLA